MRPRWIAMVPEILPITEPSLSAPGRGIEAEDKAANGTYGLFIGLRKSGLFARVRNAARDCGEVSIHQGHCTVVLK